jgi:hypothetical protein
LEEGKSVQAVEVLDKMQEVIAPELFPLNTSLISGLNTIAVSDAVEIYVAAGEPEKAEKLGDALAEETFATLTFYSRLKVNSESEISSNFYMILQLMNVIEPINKERADAYEQRLREWSEMYQE